MECKLAPPGLNLASLGLASLFLLPLRLGIIDTTNQTHIFAHAVSVIPRGSEGVFAHHPPAWENNKVTNGSSGYGSLSGKDTKDRWILEKR
jgi:hypothetical protein